MLKKSENKGSKSVHFEDEKPPALVGPKVDLDLVGRFSLRKPAEDSHDNPVLELKKSDDIVSLSSSTRVVLG